MGTAAQCTISGMVWAQRRAAKPLVLCLAALFSFFCLLASFGIGNMSQVNSIVSNVHTAFGIPTIGHRHLPARCRGCW